jgi:hypothetical protein
MAFFLERAREEIGHALFVLDDQDLHAYEGNKVSRVTGLLRGSSK